VISALNCRSPCAAARPKEFSEEPQLEKAPDSQLEKAEEDQLDSAACSKLERFIPLHELPTAESQLLNWFHEAKVSAKFAALPDHEERFHGIVSEAPPDQLVTDPLDNAPSEKDPLETAPLDSAASPPGAPTLQLLNQLESPEAMR
jgi:hypothetical protein